MATVGLAARGRSASTSLRDERRRSRGRGRWRAHFRHSRVLEDELGAALLLDTFDTAIELFDATREHRRERRLLLREHCLHVRRLAAHLWEGGANAVDEGSILSLDNIRKTVRDQLQSQGKLSADEIEQKLILIKQDKVDKIIPKQREDWHNDDMLLGIIVSHFINF